MWANSDWLRRPIEYVKGVGPQRAEVLKTEVGIFTLFDLLTWYPYRYIDKTRLYRIAELAEDLPGCLVKGRLVHVEALGPAHNKRIVARLEDGSGMLELVWFKGARWVAPQLKLGAELVVFGKPVWYKGYFQFTHPEIEKPGEGEGVANLALQPLYNSTEKMKQRGLDSRGLARLIRTVLTQDVQDVPEVLPSQLVQRLGLMARRDALLLIHNPPHLEALEQARKRLKFDELFFIQLELLKTRGDRHQHQDGFVFAKVGDAFQDFFHHHLPFTLTDAQKRVVKEIRADLGRGKQMNRLLQGDVGSGKTLVALLCALLAKDNGFQSCLMAPTEILAQQHAETFQKLLAATSVKVGLLTGSTKAAQRKPLLEALKSGELDIIIGTHALLEDPVVFHNLGLAIIDEQHRFGVAQRSRLWAKNTMPPHVLVMTATPIPRTLAMTLYGDLDASIIDQMPAGRKPIQTLHKTDAARNAVFGFMREQIALGRQVYLVYPLIEESEKMDYKDLMDGYESVVRAFPLPDYRVSIVHGKMKAADKEYEMNRFSRGETQILVATTVIEVGVNVPNASVMVIESAERFGLSQLHQLRGRVGRGAEQSYCILMTGPKVSAESKERIATMLRTNDGFEIADADLRLRGPGDLQGTRQSGVMDLRLADLVEDAHLLQVARKCADELLSQDPALTAPEHAVLLLALQSKRQPRISWSRIS
jgi:ATP-dependent DNA helicase RecG